MLHKEVLVLGLASIVSAQTSAESLNMKAALKDDMYHLITKFILPPTSCRAFHKDVTLVTDIFVLMNT